MKKLALMLLCGVFLSQSSEGQQIVDPSAFPGHYFTEKKMIIETGSYSKKKKDEIDFTFDAANGVLLGVVPGFENESDKIIFRAENPYNKWAADTKIWILRNGNVNGIRYGKDMFNVSNYSAGTFIEDGVFVLFDYTSGVDPDKKVFDVVMNEQNVRIIAKDKSKLTMDKMEAAKRVEDLLNRAGGKQMKKTLDDQEKAVFAFPKETLTKSDKGLKKDIVELFSNTEMPADDQTDFICAYTTGSDWNIITNKLTGAILGREIGAEMVRKGRLSGKCRRYPYIIQAAYTGSGYTKPHLKTKYDMVECDCADAAKNK